MELEYKDIRKAIDNVIAKQGSSIQSIKLTDSEFYRFRASLQGSDIKNSTWLYNEHIYKGVRIWRG
jgi:hypothetical protein